MKQRILIIEDSADIRETTAELLELSGYEVQTAADGLEGIRALKHHPVDLIICDIMMPHLDGFGVLQVLAQDPEWSQIPFIFLTAKTDRMDMRRGMDMGADDFLTKPFQEVELLKSIETRLKKRRPNPSLNQTASDAVQVDLAQEALAFLDFPTYIKEKKPHRFLKKQVVYAEAEPAQRVYYVLKGKLKTYHINEEGKAFITSFVNAGDFFGFVDVMEEQVHRETAEALEESELLSIPAGNFMELLAQNIHLEIHFRKALTAHLMQQEKVLMSMAYQSLRKRVALVLVELAETFGASINKPFVIRLSREDLANRVGTATESVIRTLSEFKKEGLLEIKGSEMTILNLAALMELKY